MPKKKATAKTVAVKINALMHGAGKSQHKRATQHSTTFRISEN
jgi:hypothetical protein